MSSCCCDGDIYAATRIVATDPDQGTDTNLAAALANLPAAGGTIFVKDPQSVSQSLIAPLKDVEIEFAAGAEVTTTGLGTNPLFILPTGLASEKEFLVVNIRAVGEDVVGQFFMEIGDENSRWRPILYEPDLTLFRGVFDITVGDVTYAEPVRVFVNGGRIIPPNATSTLLASPTSPGTFPFGMSAYFNDCISFDVDSTKGWTFNFDGDLISKGSTFRITGTSVLDGLQMTNTGLLNIGGVGDSLECVGGSFDSNNSTDGAFIGGLIVKFSFRLFRLSNIWLSGGASLILNAQKISVTGLIQDVGGGIANVCVDILSGADNCQVEGIFANCSVAGIRTAAQKGSFRGAFVPSGGGKAIIELAGADFNVAAGCTGLGVAAANVTIVGANSVYNVGTANAA